MPPYARGGCYYTLICCLWLTFAHAQYPDGSTDADIIYNREEENKPLCPRNTDGTLKLKDHNYEEMTACLEDFIMK